MVQKLSVEQETFHTLNKRQVGDLEEKAHELMLLSAG